MTGEQSTVRKKKTRSPAYPALSLERAVERVERIFREEGRHAAALPAVASHWDVSPSSGGFLTAISALKQFGFVADEGSGQARSIQLTNLALDVAIPGSSEKRNEAIREAALRPKLYNELWSKWEGELPSNATIEHHLVRDRKFNHKAVGNIIKNFRATIRFAGLEPGDTLDDTEEDEDTSDAGGDEGELAGRQQGGINMRDNSPPPPRDALPLPIVMEDGSVRVVNIPKMTRTAFDFFKQQLDAYRKAIVIDQQDQSGNGDE